VGRGKSEALLFIKQSHICILSCCALDISAGSSCCRICSSAPIHFAIIMLQLSSKGAMNVHRAESPHQHLMAGAVALDPRRAEAANKHVRALNTQFARSETSSFASFSCAVPITSEIVSCHCYCFCSIFSYVVPYSSHKGFEYLVNAVFL
jgi:hypothetical protein